jgi:hypothetical protein
MGDQDKVAALSVIYSATRADSSSILNVSLAMLGAGAAYVTATLAFADKFGNGISWVAVAALPAPLWIIAAYHSLITAVAMLNGVTLITVEKQLLDTGGIPPRIQRHIGFKQAEEVFNIQLSRWPHKVATAGVYGGAAAIVSTYTIYMVRVSWSHAMPWPVIFGTVYLAFFIVTGWSWAVGLRLVSASAKACGKP